MAQSHTSGRTTSQGADQWNFVSSRVERIEQAKEEWAQGRFDTVPGDAEEFIPLPQTKDKPRRATGGVFYP